MPFGSCLGLGEAAYLPLPTTSVVERAAMQADPGGQRADLRSGVLHGAADLVPLPQRQRYVSTVSLEPPMVRTPELTNRCGYSVDPQDLHVGQLPTDRGRVVNDLEVPRNGLSCVLTVDMTVSLLGLWARVVTYGNGRGPRRSAVLVV
jgi:hypothetical protein